MGLLEDIDKSPLRSKKFIAYLLAELTWKIIILVTLFLGLNEGVSGDAGRWWFVFTVVTVAGFIEVGYIGGQAWLDKYVRVAKITSLGKGSPDPE
jgi:hypothetical protein